MKAYSIFLVVLMMVNFVLIIYQERKRWKIIFLISLISVGIYGLALLNSQKIDEYFMLIASTILIIPPFLAFVFHLPAKYFYLGVSLICFARIFGLPSNGNFGEKDLEPILAGGVYYVFLLWIYALFSYPKKYQKIIFWVSSIWIILLSFVLVAPKDIAISLIMEYFNLAYGLAILLGFGLFFILFHPFFYMGEFFLFFYLCYRYIKNKIS